jgi:hypothetical protein
MSYLSQLGLGSSGTGNAGGWRKGDVAEGGESESPQPLHILCVGTIVRGEIEMDVSMPPWVDPNEPVELQRLLDEAEQTAEYEDDIEDRNIWRKGQW